MYIIIVCIYDLGLFATEEDQQQQQPQHSHWIATGFPPTWQQEEILPIFFKKHKNMLLTKCVQLKGYCPFAANPCFRERPVTILKVTTTEISRAKAQISPCGVLALGLWPCEAAGMNVPDGSLEPPSEPHVLQQTCAALGGFSPMALRMKVPNSNFETLIEWSRVALQWLCKPLCAFEWLWF